MIAMTIIITTIATAVNVLTLSHAAVAIIVVIVIAIDAVTARMVANRRVGEQTRCDVI